MCFGYSSLCEIVQDRLPASLSVIPNTASLTTCEYISTDVTTPCSPLFGATEYKIVRASIGAEAPVNLTKPPNKVRGE